MKKLILLCLLAAISGYFLSGCTNKEQQKNNYRIRYALFIHVGTKTAPVFPLLIYTNENDSTYLKYCRMDGLKTKFIPYVFPIDEYEIEHMEKYHVSDSLFNHISNFIIKNDTKTESFKDFSADNYWVFFQDDTDTLTFTLDGGYMTGNVNQFFDGIREFIPEFDKSMPQRRK